MQPRVDEEPEPASGATQSQSMLSNCTQLGQLWSRGLRFERRAPRPIKLAAISHAAHHCTRNTRHLSACAICVAISLCRAPPQSQRSRNLSIHHHTERAARAARSSRRTWASFEVGSHHVAPPPAAWEESVGGPYSNGDPLTRGSAGRNHLQCNICAVRRSRIASRA